MAASPASRGEVLTARPVTRAAVSPLRVHTHSVSAEVAAHFEKLILLGDLRPGDRLPSERELSADFGVSRASLREAMHELEAKHLIERRPGRGTTVLPAPSHVTHLYDNISDTDHQLRDIAELREALEPRLARFAAMRATPANVLELEAILSVATTQPTKVQSVRLDLQFHLLLAQASQNPLMASITTLVSSWTSATRELSHATRHAREVSHRGHLEILDAIRGRDGEGAFDAMTRHLSDVATLTLANCPTAGGGR